MCLLIVLAQVRDDLPLVVAGNRDEQLDRPATPMAVLSERDPRIVGGRDDKAGGTWLAVNEHGVVAGLTNRPTAAGPDASKRSRGGLPIACTRHASAGEAVRALATEVRPSEYNAAWLLVGDRTSMFAVDIGGDEAVAVIELGPGIHILENRPYGAPSPKIDRVRSLLDGVDRCGERELVERLALVLADHHVPEGLSAAAEAGRADVPPEVGAACVHAERYGTRWSGIVTVPAGSGSPGIRYAAGSPCTTAFADASALLAVVG